MIREQYRSPRNDQPPRRRNLSPEQDSYNEQRPRRRSLIVGPSLYKDQQSRQRDLIPEQDSCNEQRPRRRSLISEQDSYNEQRPRRRSLISEQDEYNEQQPRRRSLSRDLPPGQNLYNNQQPRRRAISPARKLYNDPRPYLKHPSPGRNFHDDPRPRWKQLSPIARIIVLLPLALVLFVYAHTWDATQWGGALLIALQNQVMNETTTSAPKPLAVAEVKASGPTYSRSWYVETSPNTAMTDMQTLAQHDVQWTLSSNQCNNSHYASFVLLDFGEPHTSNGVYGTYSVNTNLFWSDGNIAAAAQRYLESWRGVSPNCRIKLALGLSNHHQCAYNGPSCSITEVGVLWAEMVNNLNTWIHNQGFDQQMQVWGAYDAETTWDGADRTRMFVDGFNAHDAYKVPLVDFGDMRQGTPLVDPDTGQPEQPWTDADRYYIAWQAPYDVSLPEIYDRGTLWDWVRLQQNDPHMRFLGIMTEACVAGQPASPTDPRVNCGSIFNGYGYSPTTAFLQLKQNMQQQDPIYYVTSMPVPF
ncbi:MAG TPA: hypothetical protein VFA41_14690 [Ktedonobacteraceae bacterium]|nr:hypothetical protein [Ktedonobacteraceae bacterium]